MTNLPTNPRTATTLVKSVLVGTDGIREVHSRYSPNGVQTIVHLAGSADFDAVLTFLRGAFADVVVSGSKTGFISISFRPWSKELFSLETILGAVDSVAVAPNGNDRKDISVSRLRTALKEAGIE